MAPGFVRKFIGQTLNVVGATPRIDDAGGAGFLLQNNLCIARDAGGKIRWQGECLVERIGMQRLGLALGCRHRFDHGAGNIVEHVLRRQRPARRLTVGAQRQ